MKRLILLSVILLVLGSLGTAKALNDIESNQAKDLAEKTATQHDEFDSEDKMQEKADAADPGFELGRSNRLGGLENAQANLKGGTIAQTVIGGLIENTNKNDERWGFEILRVEETSEESDAENTVNLLIIDQLDDRKQVNTIDSKTVDDIQAGKGDEGRKEIAVISKRSSRKGRNPQTGKEIKIPARSGYGHNGREPEEKELEMIIADKESGEEYFIHATALVETLKEDVSLDLREGRKGMNTVDVRRTD